MAQYLINVPEDIRYEEVERCRTKKLSHEELYGDAMTLDESKRLLLEHIHRHFHHDDAKRNESF